MDETTLEGLAARLPTLDPSCGATRLIAVDGHAGAGKSTLAARLAGHNASRTTPLVHLDDLATHEEPFAWTTRLTDQLLTPLSQGRTAVHDVYDWTLRRFAGTREVPPAPVVLLEGVGAGRRALRPYLALVLWLEVPPDEAHRRGLHRDGAALTDFWTEWTRAEEAHFAADPTRPYADLLVRQTEEGDGYTAAPGPRRRTSARRSGHVP